MTPRPATDVLVELSAFLGELVDVPRAVAASLELAGRLLDAEMVGIARHEATGVVVLGTTAPEVATFYGLPREAATGEHPWTALPDGPATTWVPDTRTGTGLPVLGHHLDARGIRSFRSIALTPRHARGMTLDVFSPAPGAFADYPDDVRVLLGYAGLSLLGLDLADNLRRALESREVIAQAQGVLMERFALGEAPAMAVLRRHSQQSHVKLREVARQLIERELTVGLAEPSPAPDHEPDHGPGG